MRSRAPVTLLLEGPFESDYSLAIVNRRLAAACLQLGLRVRLHQRDNTVPYPPSAAFLRDHHELAPAFCDRLPTEPADVHSRYIYPPYTDRFAGRIKAVHCYGWEESRFPRRFVEDFNRDLDLVTVMSAFVRDVLRAAGVRVPIAVTGLGADHILERGPVPVPDADLSDFTFLHVSSCFPRKAADVLVAAFCREFTRRDQVRLIIKTFDNPHNRVREIVAQADAAWPSHAPIQVLWRRMSTAEIRWLYEQSGCLVSPSRGEGFGLPVAEAMLAGCPVIATVYSGQADICSEEVCWPVEYRLEPAITHLTDGDSYWAEPSIASLQHQMRTVYQSSQAQRRPKTEAASRFVRSRFTWAQVAERHWQACCEAFEYGPGRPKNAARPTHRIGFVTTWNDRCGIAEYSRYLVGALPDSCRPIVFANRSRPVRADEPYVTRCWSAGEAGPGPDSLADTILKSGVSAVSIQFNFGFFAAERLNRLVAALRQHEVTTVITMHATQHQNLARIRPALSQADACVCHLEAGVEAIRALEPAATVVLQRQGIPQFLGDREALRAGRRRPPGSFLVACFGFFLPPKGIDQLIHAVALARRVHPGLHLRLVNALYPVPASEQYASRCIALLQHLLLGGCSSLRTDFLDDTDVMSELAAADLVVLPYVYSSESSSAAIRLPIASGTPVLCSDLSIFDEFDGCIHRFPAGNPVALANAIIRLSRNPHELAKYSARQVEVARELAWPNIAAKFAGLLLSHIGSGRRTATGQSSR